jgi:hypothetical protein
MSEPAWREFVEQRLLNWRQRLVNKSGDQLALDDFMDKESLEDLIDYVCDEWAGPESRQPIRDCGDAGHPFACGNAGCMRHPYP